MNEHPQLADRKLYLVCDSRFAGLEAAIENGVDIVQLRDRELGDRDLLAHARSMAEVARRAGALFVVNHRPDIALLAGAGGVHVGQDDIAPSEIREIAGDRLLIGQSTHSEAQISAAMRDGVDYIGVGPVFATPTKPGRAPVGIDLVGIASRRAEVPWFAIGGIDLTNAPSVIDAGATRIAVVRAIADADDPGRAAAALRAQLAAAVSSATPARARASAPRRPPRRRPNRRP